jgi:hypothetical protein
MHAFCRIVSGVLVVALAAPGLAYSQTPTLGELARREQERRKATQSSTKVLTNKDLPAPKAGAATPASDPGTAAEPAAPAEPQPGSEKDESWWRNRINAARESLRRNEAFAEALQSRVNGLSTDFVNRDDPYQRAKIGEDRQKALAELERVKAEIALGKKQIEDIEEEARKSGVPPGWLR